MSVFVALSAFEKTRVQLTVKICYSTALSDSLVRTFLIGLDGGKRFL